MPQPSFITFTGIDDRTDLARANKLAEKYPIEWGVLFAKNALDARFPSMQTVNEILNIQGRKSAHLCGALAKTAQMGRSAEHAPLQAFDRVQINGFRIDKSNLHTLSGLFDVDIILQNREFKFSDDLIYHELFDCSGGKGLFPTQVPSLPESKKLVGYSGGMSTNTVMDYLSMIRGDGPFWIDMEGLIRTNGWFDLDLVERVCELVYYKNNAGCL